MQAVPPVFSVRVRELLPAETVGWQFCVSPSDRLIEIVADVIPRTGAVSQRVPQEVGTGEIGWAAPTTEIDFLIAPVFAFADLGIECDCDLAS